MLLTLIISGMVWAQELPYIDTDFACTDQVTAQKYVRDYNIDTRSFGGLELCNSQVDTKKLLNDLEILEKGHFNTIGDNLFIKGFIPADSYYSWMKSQTYGVERGNDIPSATAYNSGGYFTMQDGWALLSTLGRVGTIVHEARHTAGYRHVRCTQGPYQGASMAGCDTTYQYAGSHAIEMEYYARVSVLGTNFHPVYKAMARLMGIARSNFVFNQPVITKKEAVLAMTQNGSHADLIMDDQVIEREVPQKEGMLKRTSFGGAVFDGVQAYAIELYGDNHLNTPIEDTYSYYKLLDRADGPIFDFEEFDVPPKRYSVQMKDDHSLQFFNYPSGVWNRKTALNFQAQRSATRLENGQTGLFLIDAQGTIFPVSVQNLAVGRPLDTKWNPSHVDIAAYNGKTLILKTDGVIYEKQTDGSESVWSLGKDRYSALINAPVYDGFVVEH